tara:strand:+ start:60523 stop:60762 length:240 start_codon:yes stop_codon:yes gene_type:complete
LAPPHQNKNKPPLGGFFVPEVCSKLNDIPQHINILISQTLCSTEINVWNINKDFGKQIVLFAYFSRELNQYCKYPIWGL